MSRNYDREKARARRLQKTYGITVEDYEKLLAAQGGGCALCGKTPEEEGIALAVDHLHHPPYPIRGILCRYCNHRVVGRHKDPDLLRRVADYLENDTGFFAPPPIKRKKRGKTSRSKRTTSRH